MQQQYICICDSRIPTFKELKLHISKCEVYLRRCFFLANLDCSKPKVSQQRVFRNFFDFKQHLNNSINRNQKLVLSLYNQKMAEENELHLEDLVYWLNQARVNPQILIPFLENHLQNFRNQKQLELSPKSFYLTFEGKKAWIEAIEFLRNQTPLNPLVRHSGLNKSSNDHAKDLGLNFATGERGSDGSTLVSRIKRYCVYESGLIGQTVAQQLKKKVRDHARETVLSLIICDGDVNRTDRKQIFNEEYRYFGVSVSESAYGYVTVINYSNVDLAETNSGVGVLGNKTNLVDKSINIKKTISAISTDSENNYTSNITRSNAQRIY